MNSVWWLLINLWALCVCGIVGTTPENCRIPDGRQYESSIYRTMYAYPPRDYRQREEVRHRTRVVVICKKDIYGDAIRRTKKSKCLYGNWIPELPSCEEKRRCYAPEVVANAESSRPLDEYITFPHGGIVMFTCANGMIPSGDGTTVCNDGTWTEMDFRCQERSLEQESAINEIDVGITETITLKTNARSTTTSLATDRTQTSTSLATDRTHTTTSLATDRTHTTTSLATDRTHTTTSLETDARPTTTSRPRYYCSDVTVPNADVTPIPGRPGRFNVTCKNGTSLKIKAESFVCRRNRWLGVEPICQQVAGQQSQRCRYPYHVRRYSEMTSKLTGEDIHSYYIPDHTAVVQTCKSTRYRKRHSLCDNGVWKPPLMACRRRRLSNRLFFREAAYKNCTIPESGQKVTYTAASDKDTNSYAVGDSIESGHAVIQTPVYEGPGDGPRILTCVGGILKSTAIKTPAINGSEYRVHVKLADAEKVFPVSIVLSGAHGKKTKLRSQNFTILPNDVLEFGVTAYDVGHIRRLWIESPASNTTSAVEFVSVYKADVHKYYVSHNVYDRQSRLCARKFQKPISWSPDWSTRPEYKDLQNVADTKACNLACVEEKSFRCQAAFLDADQRCYMFKHVTNEDMRSVPNMLTKLFVRRDICV